MKKLFFLFVLSNFIYPSITLGQFTLTQVKYIGRWVSDPIGSPAFYTSDFNIDFYIHENMYSFFNNQNFEFSDIQDMANKWNSISDSRFNIALHDNDATPDNQLVYDEVYNNLTMHNVIAVDVNGNIWPSQFNLGHPHDGVLAISNRYNVNNCNDSDPFKGRLKGCDIIINSKAPIKKFTLTQSNNGNPDYFDLLSILLHEFGHAGGLGDCPISPEDPDYAMSPNSLNGFTRRKLNALDKWAMVNLYNDASQSYSCSNFDESRLVEKCSGELQYTDPNPLTIPIGCNDINPFNSEYPKCNFCDADKEIKGKIYNNDSKSYYANSSITAKNDI